MSLSDVMLVLTTKRTHDFITIEDLYVEVNMYVTLWSDPLTEVTGLQNIILKWNSRQKATKALLVIKYELNLCLNA